MPRIFLGVSASKAHFRKGDQSLRSCFLDSGLSAQHGFVLKQSAKILPGLAEGRSSQQGGCCWCECVGVCALAACVPLARTRRACVPVFYHTSGYPFQDVVRPNAADEAIPQTDDNETLESRHVADEHASSVTNRYKHGQFAVESILLNC